MFVNPVMINRLGQINKIRSRQVYQVGQVLPVLTADKILSGRSHQVLKRELQQQSGLNQDYFILLYQRALERYAEFVQVLPWNADSILCELLNRGVSKAILALRQFLSQEINRQEQDPLLIYAIFTAALFFDVAKVFTLYQVVITNEQGEYMTDWHPFDGSLVEKGEYYKLYPLAEEFHRLDRECAALLAKELLPKEGFLWLSADRELFADWLNTLRGEFQEGGRVSLALSLIKDTELDLMADSLGQVPIEVITSPATQYADEFYIWLRDGIGNGDIKVNTPDAGVHVFPDGVFIDSRIFEHFAEVSKLPVDRNVVFAQFGNLFGITKKGGHDFMHDKYFSDPASQQSSQALSFLAKQSKGQRMGIKANSAVIFKKEIPDSAMVIKVSRKLPALMSVEKKFTPKAH